MQVRALLLVALIGANAGLLGSRAGDALVRRSERTIATRLDHRGDGALRLHFKAKRYRLQMVED